MLIALTGYQITIGNFNFFIQGVTVQHQHFHAVTQGRRNGVQDVGGGDEHHFGKIKRYIQVMITERKILLGIKYFQQCR